MRKNEIIYREILYQAIERKNRRLSQLYLSKELNLSLSTVNLSLKALRKMNAVEVRQRSLIITDAKKILYFWASVRDLQKDIVYSTRVDLPAYQIESQMPTGIVYASFSAYKLKFKDVPTDYSEIYVYGEKEGLEKRFPRSDRPANLFVLKKDSSTEKYGNTATIAQLFVDLWNQKEWYAKDFLNALEVRIGGLLE